MTNPGRRRDYTPAEILFLRTGIMIFAMGVLSFILPLFGLQFAKIASSPSQMGVGFGLVIVGLLVTALAGMRARVDPEALKRVFKWLVLGATALVILIVTVAVIGGILLNRAQKREFEASTEKQDREAQARIAQLNRPSFAFTQPTRPGQTFSPSLAPALSPSREY